MIIYNVTCSMDKAMSDEWLEWMLEVHIPEVMASGCFLSFKVMKMLTQVPDDIGVNYAIQYSANSMAEYERYRTDFGPGLQKQTLERYGDKVTAFRTLLEEIKG